MGTPPQMFSVIADTGSTLMAFPCQSCGSCGKHENHRYKPEESSTSQKIPCAGIGYCRSCNSDQCGYSQSYTEGSSLRGIMYYDQAWLGAPDESASLGNTYGVKHPLGCHTFENGLFSGQLADGIMGLGRNSPSIVNTLMSSGKLDEKVFTMCLHMEGGNLGFGGVDTALHTGELQWLPLGGGTFYSVTVNAFTVGSDSPISSPSSAIVDSGTTFTYVPGAAFNAIRNAYAGRCSAGKCGDVTPKQVQGESLCYVAAGGVDVIKQNFPPLTITFNTGATLQLPPEHVFIDMVWDGTNTFCLGVYKNNGNSVVVGANAMMGHDFVFDMAKNKVGWAPALPGCARAASGDNTPASPSAQAKPSQGASTSSQAHASASAAAVPASPQASPAAQVTPTASASVVVNPANAAWEGSTPGSVYSSGLLNGVLIAGAVVFALAALLVCRRAWCTCGPLVFGSRARYEAIVASATAYRSDAGPASTAFHDAPTQDTHAGMSRYTDAPASGAAPRISPTRNDREAGELGSAVLAHVTLDDDSDDVLDSDEDARLNV